MTKALNVTSNFKTPLKTSTSLSSLLVGGQFASILDSPLNKIPRVNA